jgi:putative MATE family efflux protein
MNFRPSKEIPGMFDGPIVPLTIRIATPMLIGQIVQLLYMVIDTIFIARIDPSSTALLSGTGLAFPLFFLFMAIGMSINVGVSSLIGRIIGENRREVAPNILASGLLIALAIAVPVLGAGYPFGSAIFHILAGSKLSEQAIGYGLQFYYFLLPGLALMLTSQVFIGMLQGEGRTDTMAKAMVASTVFNIILDPVFIFGLHMGVAGAGLATTVSIIIAMVYAVIMLKSGGSHLPLTFNIIKSQIHFLREIVRIGFPNFLSMASMSFSFMILNKLVSGIGQTEMNGWTLVGRMDQIVLIPSFAISGATISMIAQNFGRGNLDRVRAIYRTNVRLGVTVVAAVALTYILTSGLFFPFFSTVKEVVGAAVRQVHYIAFTFIGVSAAIISTAAFQATGKPLPALALSLLRIGLIAIPTAAILTLVFHWGMLGVFAGLMIGNLSSLPIAYVWTRRHLKRLVPKTIVG